jgi:hypothetical protein
MYKDKDDKKPGALNKLAKAKAMKKMSKTSKVGKMLDKKEMENAPRKPFVERFTRKDSPTPRKPFTERFTRRGAPKGAK